MSGSSISAIIASVALVFLILGFLFGWMRGYQKSLTRLIIVLVVAVVAFFITPLLTNAVLTMDISGLNIRINGDLITNVKDYVITMLKSIQQVREALEASSTLEAFITALPAMVVNTFLFTIIFFLLKWISMAFYAIFAFTVFSKKKMENKNKIKLLGAGIGVVQALVVTLVLLVPVFGYVAIAGNLAETAEAVSATSTSVVSTSTNAEDTAHMPSISIDEATGYVNKYTTAFNNTWVVKVYRAVGADKLSIAVFNELSKQKVGDVETNISEELNTAAKLVPIALQFTQGDLEINSKLVDNASDALDIIYGKDGKPTKTVLGEIINEVVKYTAQKLSNGEEFMGFRLENFVQDEKLQDVAKDVLSKLATTNKINIKSDAKNMVKVAGTLVESGIVSRIQDGEDVKTVVLDVLTENGNTTVRDIVTSIANSPVLSSVVPKIVNMGLDIVYEELGTTLPTDEEELLNYKVDEEEGISADDADNFQIVFANIAKVYKEIDSRTEGQEIIEVLNFEGLGAALDSMSQCELFRKAGKGLLGELLTNELITGIAHGTDTPNSEDGENGNYYLNTTNNYIYKKVSGVWAHQNNTITTLNGTSAPDNENGTDGNYYVNTVTYDVYHKESGAWKQLNTRIIPGATTTRLINAWGVTDTEDENYVNYASTFKGIGEMVEAAKTLASTDNPKEAITAALTAITSEGVDSDIIESVLSSENLQNAGLDENIADAVVEVVTSITEGLADMDEEERAKEIEGIATALDLITQTQTQETGTIDTITEEKAEEIIDAISESTIILDLIDTATEVSGAVDTSKLDDDTKDNLGSAINNNGNLTAEQKAQLLAMLGIS